ncbi:MAG: methyltransferase, partial [Acidimicrobiia bacterium]|nr:methyltransferase [Acidimicrobiia bacterium]
MIEAGSFRDPESRVFYADGRVVRGLSDAAAEVDRAARDAGLMDQLVSSGLFVENWPVGDVEAPAGTPDAAFIESRRLPLINYPAEWSFAMLRAAALVTLDANLAALAEGFILKDASAFNVVFVGTRPVIIDVGSIDHFGDKGIWTAYGQFCDHFLAPLMLEAH